MLISQRYRWEEAGSGREVHGTTELHCQVDHRFHQLRITLMSGSLSSSPVGRWNPGANLSLIHCWRTQVLRRLHHFSGCWTLERVKIDPRVCQPPCCDSLPHSWGTWKTPSSQNTSHNSPGMERRGGVGRTTLGRKLWWYPTLIQSQKESTSSTAAPAPKRWTLSWRLHYLVAIFFWLLWLLSLFLINV